MQDCQSLTSGQQSSCGRQGQRRALCVRQLISCALLPASVRGSHALLLCSRTQQISEFLRVNPTAQQVNSGASDSTTYTLQLHTGSAGLLTLHIMLGPLFPERPPVCQLTTSAQGLRLQHRYLDAGGYLSQHPKLQAAQWSPHTNFALLIQQLAREIVQQPPQLVGGSAPAFSSAAGGPSPPPMQYGYQPPPPQQHSPHQQHSSPHSHSNSPHANGAYTSSPAPVHPFSRPPPPLPVPHQQGGTGVVPPLPPRRHSPSPDNHVSASGAPSPSLRTRPPDVPSSFPHLDALSIQALEDVLAGGNEAVRDMAAEMEPVRQLQSVQRECVQRISAKAKENLAAKDTLEALGRQLTEAVSQLREAQQQSAALQQRQHSYLASFTLPHLLSLLDAATEDAEEESERCRERFEALAPRASAPASGADGGGPASASWAEEQAALEQYIKQRMAVHERAGKKERLTEVYGRQ